jgi:N-acyl-D-aspartate/D-glutamate deacylase
MRARDTARGVPCPGLLLSHFGERQASETTDFFGFADRAHVAAGLRADVNLIDLEQRSEPIVITLAGLLQELGQH